MGNEFSKITSQELVSDVLRGDSCCAGPSDQKRARLPFFQNDDRANSLANNAVFAVHPGVVTPAICERTLKLVVKQLVNHECSQNHSTISEHFQRRTIVDTESPGLRAYFWPLIRAFVPLEFQARKLVGLHPVVRLIGQQCCKRCSTITNFSEDQGTTTCSVESRPEFPPAPLHVDSCFTSFELRASSCITAFLYLNADFEGGATRFVHSLSSASSSSSSSSSFVSSDVLPQAGQLLVFEHGLPHQALSVFGGTKIAIKFSILYEDKPQYVADSDRKLAFFLGSRSKLGGEAISHALFGSPIFDRGVLLEVCAFLDQGPCRKELANLLEETTQKISALTLFKFSTPSRSAHDLLLDYILELSHGVQSFPSEVIAPVLMYLMQSLSRGDVQARLRVYACIQYLPQFRHSELALLIAETLMKDSQDPSPLIRAVSISTIFLIYPLSTVVTNWSQVLLRGLEDCPFVCRALLVAATNSLIPIVERLAQQVSMVNALATLLHSSTDRLGFSFETVELVRQFRAPVLQRKECGDCALDLLRIFDRIEDMLVRPS